jgi:hypothetical protein
MFQSNLDLPLNIKKVYHDLTEFLPKFGNVWGPGFRVMNFDSRPFEPLRHDFMRARFEFRHILHLVLMAALNFTKLIIQLTPFTL